MRFIYCLLIFLNLFHLEYIKAQTCTITSSTNWGSLSCDETGSGPVAGDMVVITSGVTVSVTGNENFNGNLTVENGGVLDLSSNGKLKLGSGNNCGRYIVIESGAFVSGNSSSDQLTICNDIIGQGGGSCDDTNNPPQTGDSPPYCINSGTGLTGEVAIDENGVNPTLLPVNLIFLKGNLNQNKIDLKWQTASETDFDYFEVRHASDGYDFDLIGKVQGKGSEEALTNYYFSHAQIAPGNNYYMLVAVDIDGSKEFSKIINVYNDQFQVEIYPTLNYLSGAVNIVLPLHNYQFVKIRYTDTHGINVYESILDEVNGGFIKVSPSKSLKPNIYFVEVITDRFTYKSKVFVVE